MRLASERRVEPNAVSLSTGVPSNSITLTVTTAVPVESNRYHPVVNVFDAVAAELRKEGFTPGSKAEKDSPGLTLFAAVRRVHGMDPEDADVCYWDWRTLRSHLVQVWQALDAEAGIRAGIKTQAVAWAYPANRDLAAVLDLLESASRAMPQLEPLQALPRAVSAGMVAGRKPRGAISSTLGVLHVATQRPFGLLFASVLATIVPGTSNEMLLDRLDEMARSLDSVPGQPDTSTIPRLLSRYFAQGVESEVSLWSTYVEFLEHVTDGGRDQLSDDELAEWLLARAPERVTARRPATATSSPMAATAFSTHEPADAIGAGRTFAAIDVETANAQRASICAIGIVIVEDGEVTGRYKWLVQPPLGFQTFSPFNTAVHGIRAADVAGAPTFASVLPKVAELLNGLPVVAHNASFDVGAIRLACLASEAPMPTFHYGCTMALSRASLQLPSYSLPFCADALGIKLDRHHDALADAEGAALVALALLDHQNVEGLDGLLADCRLRWGLLSEVEWLRVRFRQGPSRSGKRVQPTDPNPNADPSHPLYGCSAALTGDLVVMTRQQAFDRLAELGGIAQANVTRTTQILVVGDLNPAVLRPGEAGTGKTRKVFELQALGQPIEVLSGYDFLAMLD